MRGGGGGDVDVVREGAVVVDGGGEVVGHTPLVVDDELDVMCAGPERDGDGECRIIVRAVVRDKKKQNVSEGDTIGRIWQEGTTRDGWMKANTHSFSIGSRPFQFASPARARKTDLPPPCHAIWKGMGSRGSSIVLRGCGVLLLLSSGGSLTRPTGIVLRMVSATNGEAGSSTSGSSWSICTAGIWGCWPFPFACTSRPRKERVDGYWLRAYEARWRWCGG